MDEIDENTVTESTVVDENQPINESKVCPACKTLVSPEDEFCGHCGIELSENTNDENVNVEESTVNTATNSETEEKSVMDPTAMEQIKFHSAVNYPITADSLGVTHEGLSGKNNEDAYVVDSVMFPDHNIRLDLLLVVDGMGGEEAGEVIAKQAIYETAAGLWFLTPSFEKHKTMTKFDFWQFINNQFSNYMSNAIASANGRIVRYGKAKGLKQGRFGATIVAAVIITDLELGRVQIYGYNMGDARAYLWQNNSFEQISKDQTHLGNPLHYLGAFDHIGGVPWSREIWLEQESLDTVTLLLCSDGFWNMLPPETITNILEFNESIEESSKVLLDESMKIETPYGVAFDERTKTGDDNITLAIYRSTTQKQSETGENTANEQQPTTT